MLRSIASKFFIQTKVKEQAYALYRSGQFDEALVVAKQWRDSSTNSVDRLSAKSLIVAILEDKKEPVQSASLPTVPTSKLVSF